LAYCDSVESREDWVVDLVECHGVNAVLSERDAKGIGPPTHRMVDIVRRLNDFLFTGVR
jgi:hypothetical protein